MNLFSRLQGGPGASGTGKQNTSLIYKDALASWSPYSIRSTFPTGFPDLIFLLVGFGNFEEIGPVDVNQNPRPYSWVKA